MCRIVLFACVLTSMQGYTQLPEGYTDVREHYVGIRLVEKLGKFGLYDEAGKELILPATYDEIGPVGVVVRSGSIVRLGDQIGLIWDFGEVMLPPAYDQIEPTHPDLNMLLFVKQNGKTGIYDADNMRMVLRPDYDEILPYASVIPKHFILVKKGLYGTWLPEEGLTIPTKYTRLESRMVYDYPVILAWKGEKVGALHSWGKIMIPIAYDAIEWNEKSGFFECRKGMKIERYDADGVKK